MFKLNDPHKAILKNFGQDNSQLVKGKAAEEGETREWNGVKYRKQAGKWIEVTDAKGPGKQEEEGGGKGTPAASGPSTVARHDVAQLAHMKSIVDSNPEKAYEIYQSLSPEVQEKVPQDVVNKLVSTSHAEKEEEDVWEGAGKSEKRSEEKSADEVGKIKEDHEEVKERAQKHIKDLTVENYNLGVLSRRAQAGLDAIEKWSGNFKEYAPGSSSPEEAKKQLQETITINNDKQKENEKAIEALKDQMNLKKSINIESAREILGLEKSRQTKYFKREGSPGNYKYYYTEEEYKKSKGGEEKTSKPRSSESDQRINLIEKLIKQGFSPEEAKQKVGRVDEKKDGSKDDEGENTVPPLSPVELSGYIKDQAANHGLTVKEYKDMLGKEMITSKDYSVGAKKAIELTKLRRKHIGEGIPRDKEDNKRREAAESTVKGIRDKLSSTGVSVRSIKPNHGYGSDVIVIDAKERGKVASAQEMEAVKEAIESQGYVHVLDNRNDTGTETFLKIDDGTKVVLRVGADSYTLSEKESKQHHSNIETVFTHPLYGKMKSAEIIDRANKIETTGSDRLKKDNEYHINRALDFASWKGNTTSSYWLKEIQSSPELLKIAKKYGKDHHNPDVRALFGESSKLEKAKQTLGL